MKRLLVVVAIAGMLVSGALPAAAESGCPSGYEIDTVAGWAARGYPNAPAFLDDPANGGNGDDLVCGLRLGDGTANRAGKVLYNFRDNNVPGQTA